MGCVGVAGIQSLRQAVARVAIVVFVESQSSAVIVEGRLGVSAVMRNRQSDSSDSSAARSRFGRGSSRICLGTSACCSERTGSSTIRSQSGVKAVYTHSDEGYANEAVESVALHVSHPHHSLR